MNRRELWLIVGVSVTSSLATLGLFLVFWVGQMAFVQGKPTPQREVMAQKFVLVDADGKDRAILGVMAAGSGLFFLDKNGKDRAGLLMSADGDSSLSLIDKNGKDRVGLLVTADGEPGLILADENRARAMLETTQLVFFDKEGKVLWKAP